MSENKSRAIRLPERFDFNFHKEFYTLTAELLTDAKVQEIEMDFSQVEYLDSSALGMLVMLQKKCSEANKKAVIINARGVPADILDVANMSKLIEIR